MALLDATPKLSSERTYRVNEYYASTGIIFRYREDVERIYEWACNDAGGETTHEVTYGTGGFQLQEYARDVAHGEPGGIWREIYRKEGSWVAVP